MKDEREHSGGFERLSRRHFDTRSARIGKYMQSDAARSRWLTELYWLQQIDARLGESHQIGNSRCNDGVRATIDPTFAATSIDRGSTVGVVKQRPDTRFVIHFHNDSPCPRIVLRRLMSEIGCFQRQHSRTQPRHNLRLRRIVCFQLRPSPPRVCRAEFATTSVVIQRRCSSARSLLPVSFDCELLRQKYFSIQAISGREAGFVSGGVYAGSAGSTANSLGPDIQAGSIIRS
jgi:hypothetical protein